MANAEYCDLLDDVNVVWVRSKPHRGFKLKGKRWQNKGRKLPVPTALMEKLRDRMIAKAAKPSDLIPNTIGLQTVVAASTTRSQPSPETVRPSRSKTVTSTKY